MSVVVAIRIVVSSGFAASFTYTVYAIYRVTTYRARATPLPSIFPPVSILKPVCGVDAGLEENVATFFDQDYSGYQVVFGATRADDPALPVAREVARKHPDADVAFAGEPYREGTNRKVNNLVSICREAKHDILVVADSDVRVGRDYLKEVVAPFEDGKVGAVTCLTVADPVSGAASRLGAMYLNEDFLPSILVAMAVEPLRYCFGPTMAVRRSALEAIGGFEELAVHLADDYMLGSLVSARGYRVEVAGCVVTNVLHEPSLRSLFLHELRWARTIRRVRPAGYTSTVVTMITPWAVAMLSAFGASPAAGLALVTALALRLALRSAVHGKFRLGQPPAVWWGPVRDVLTFAVWCASHLGNGVVWRGNRFRVLPDGRLRHEGDAAA